jgi:starvation-inducible DNA-binding protein
MSVAQKLEMRACGAVRSSPIAFAREARQHREQLLNGILADTTIVYRRYEKHHWVVASPAFHQLHLLFGNHAEAQLKLVNALADRVRSVGAIRGRVEDPRHAAQLTTIERPPDGLESVAAMPQRLLCAHETVIASAPREIELTNEHEDWGSNDLLMSDIVRRYEMQDSFVTEHLASGQLTNGTH